MKYFIEATANLINIQDLIQFNLPFVEARGKEWMCSDAKNAKCWCYIPDPTQYLDKQV